ncbi:mechanosensitive ion channel family protein [Agathobaculum sp.]|uniref:mechanosensitive ion channel family protein n=1 Tax=Agathobaculum sp. TaxID=2048138 RepID=UPI002A833708|nr:mechanosensitive ion channel family protein [Agathobaculum sp.]MDY3618538.1 mechanosensitive ion channel family protein [Agathobaculum sp.]
MLSEFFSTKLGAFVGTAWLVVVSVLLTVWGAKLVSRIFRKMIERQKLVSSSNATVLAFLRYVAVAAVYFAGFAVIVSNIPFLSAGLNKVLAAGGVIALVAGFAAQEALGSVVSGLMILAFKPFVIGDVVRYLDHDISGVVEEITLHHTTIRTWENKRVIIPNSKMNSAIIENADYADSKVCVLLEIGVTYESDLALAKQLLTDAVASHPDYLDNRTPDEKAANVPAVLVRVIELGESAVTLRAWVWAKDNATAAAMKSDLLQSVKTAYEQEGIEIAYPHMVVIEKA